jgi:outer membrane immunogenic protein
MNNNSIRTALVAAIAVATPLAAQAADLPTKGPILKAPPALAFSWAGHYFGVHIGGLWGKKDWTELDIGTSSHNFSGLIGGAQLGFNMQSGPMVFGIQGDWSWTNGKGSNNCVTATYFGSTGTFECASNVKWLASVPGRVGYAMDRSMIYVKGGWAWENDSYTFNLVSPTALSVATASGTRSGWTLGGGWEMVIGPRWTAFVEYNYYDFGNRNADFTSSLAPGVTVPVEIKESKHVVKVGLNYMFDWGTSVVSRY